MGQRGVPAGEPARPHDTAVMAASPIMAPARPRAGQTIPPPAGSADFGEITMARENFCGHFGL